LTFGRIKNMAVINVIKLSEIEDSKRIDADYYQPELDLIKKKISKIGRPLKNLISYIKHPAEIKRIYECTGIPYILAENISKDFWILQFTEKRYISEKKAQAIPQNKLEVGDVLVTRTGANYGDACIYLGEPKPAYASAHTIIIRSHEITGEYLATYFNTYFGKKLIKRGWYGSSQPEISPKYLSTLPIPILNQVEEEVKATIRRAYTFIRSSKILQFRAENLFLKQLRLNDSIPPYKLWYISNLTEISQAHRLDAEYYQPLYDCLIKYLNSNFRMKPLKKFIVDFKKGIEVGAENYQEEGKLFIRVSNLSIHGFVEKDQKYITEELYHQLRNAYEPKEGDFLLTKDATPGIAYVVKEPLEGIIASGILKLKINEDEIDKEYLALCINSIIGRLQIERDGGGSVITHWKPEQIKNILIPVLPSEIQQKISSLIKQSYEARNKAKELLKIAKKKVEEAIEEKINIEARARKSGPGETK